MTKSDPKPEGAPRPAPEGGGGPGAGAPGPGAGNAEWLDELLSRSSPLGQAGKADPRYFEAWQGLMESLSANPQAWSGIMSQYAKDQAELMASAMRAGQPGGKDVAGQKKDPRFASEQWSSNPFFSFIRQNYQINSRLMMDLLDAADLDDDKRKVLKFMFRQYIDALSPSNFPATNPDVLEATVKSGGSNLASGMRNMLEDMRHGSVSNTDRGAFRVGENLALTPGKVVHQSQLVQLIEYAPRAKEVHEVPLVIFPPCINKFYILDLVPEKSLVNYLVGQGHRVFLVSWVNAGEHEAQLGWDDYLIDGVLRPMEVVRDITKQPQANMFGFCIGGTLLTCALAAAAAEGEHPARSLTLAATMIDCHDTGDIGLFVTEDSVADYERRFADGGLMSGRDLANTFAFLRPNDLIWPYVVKNYYLGETPPAFDILYWNSDSANLPGKMFVRYVRDTYLENNVAEGRSKMCGIDIDLGKVKAPCYAMATERDHIVPWTSAYRTARLLGGPVDFVLGSSGHIAGVVSPPPGDKRRFKVASPPGGRSRRPAPLPEDPEEWAAAAATEQGSWWPHWERWLRRHAGKRVRAPARPGNYKHKPIEDAPGSYVAVPAPPTQQRNSTGE